jgi:hypothetical protein
MDTENLNKLFNKCLSDMEESMKRDITRICQQEKNYFPQRADLAIKTMAVSVIEENKGAIRQKLQSAIAQFDERAFIDDWVKKNYPTLLHHALTETAAHQARKEAFERLKVGQAPRENTKS